MTESMFLLFTIFPNQIQKFYEIENMSFNKVRNIKQNIVS